MADIPENLQVQLGKVRAEIESMAASTSTHEFENHWMRFLSELRRVWNKTDATFEQTIGWRSWKNCYDKVVSGDELLRYLWEARNTDEHTVQDIAKKKDGFLGLRAGSTGSAHIRELKIENGMLKIDGDGSVEVTFRPANVHLLPVKTRKGTTVDVPHTYKGEPINPDDILNLARLGASFYEEFVLDAVCRKEAL